jgi:flavin reductase
VFYARVESVLLADGPAETLIWFDRKYHPMVAGSV